MGRHVALLRGVNNIGATTRVTMAELRSLFESLGFRQVRTLLNSGNVVFSVSDGARGGVLVRIEQALASRLGVSPVVILLSAAEVAAAVRDDPLSAVASRPSDHLVVVPRAPADLRRLKPLLARAWAPEVLALGKRVAYLWCAGGIAKSPLRIAVERTLGRSGTGRNMATLTKLHAIMNS